MDDLELISSRLGQTFLKAERYGPSVSEGSWHGPSLMESLDGVDHAVAGSRPIRGRHSIWEIVVHCAYWMEEVARALLVGKMVSVEEVGDWPDTGVTPGEWERDLARLWAAHGELAGAIGALDEGDLERTLGSHFGGNYFEFTYRKMLHGVSDHNVYHAGQISILKKK